MDSQFSWNSSYLTDHWILGPKCVNSSITEPCLEKGVAGVGLVSDMASVISTILIIVSFLVIKDLRTQARTLLFYISVADLFNSSWYMFAHIWSLVNIYFTMCYPQKPLFEVSMCIFQATMNVYFTAVSFIWTMILAIYILSLIYKRNRFITKRCHIILALVGWCIPIPFVLFGFLANIFGPGRSTDSAGWCFMAYYGNEVNLTKMHALSEILGGKFFDIFTLIVLTVVYFFAVLKYCRDRMKPRLNSVTEQEVKLVLVPVAFMFMRIWGVVRCILELYQAFNNQKRCYEFLAYMQAIGDPAQGWVNGIIFIILTKELRERIFDAFLRGKDRVCRMKRTDKHDCVVTNKYVYYNSIEREETLVSGKNS